jgi:pyroglutamyl-peptidase
MTQILLHLYYIVLLAETSHPLYDILQTMADEAGTKEIRVLVTGFGVRRPLYRIHLTNKPQPFLDIKTNPSWEIARGLPPHLTSNDANIKLIVPDTYMPAAYHKIHIQTTALIEQHNPDLIVHIGLAVDRSYFAVEQSAAKEGYHDIPDVDRRVFTRAKNKRVFGKAAEVLGSSLDLESAVGVWREACKRMAPKARAKGKPRKEGGLDVDVRLSDDVGTFVCGFAYYVGLLEMQRRRGRRDVVFLHVPMLVGEEVGVGVEVTEELIKAFVLGWKGG